jgi:hypothetical protein
MPKYQRFIKVYQEGNQLSDGIRQLIVDNQTGVTYFFNIYGNAGGLTPLLDRDGKPVITILENKS